MVQTEIINPVFIDKFESSK